MLATSYVVISPVTHSGGNTPGAAALLPAFFHPSNEIKVNKINTFDISGIGSSSDPTQRSAVTTGQPEPSPPAPTPSIEFPAAQQHQGECKWGKPPPLGKHGLLRKRRHLPGEVLFIQGCYPKHSPTGSSEEDGT